MVVVNSGIPVSGTVSVTHCAQIIFTACGVTLDLMKMEENYNTLVLSKKSPSAIEEQEMSKNPKILAIERRKNWDIYINILKQSQHQ